MLQQTRANKIFNLDIDFKDPLQNTLFSMVKGPLEHVLAFPRLNHIYEEASRLPDDRPFTEKVLAVLNISCDLSEEDRERITTASGPVIVVANHPFGGVEGIVLASLLQRVRSDVKIMANHLLNAIPDMRDLFIPVNPFQNKTSVAENIRPIRECIQWLKYGGMLVVFPAGTVSHFDIKKGAIIDPAWSTNIARIIRKTNASVLPIFFQGTNSAAFHMAGMMHPLLRTAMLPNEVFNKNRKNIQIRVGELISFEMLKAFEQDGDLTSYLRLRTYLLELRSNRRGLADNKSFFPLIKNNAGRPVIAPRSPEIMAEEIRQLPPSQILIKSGDHLVIQAEAGQIPHLLIEIGRLRELTFRAVGEGTGKPLDIDQYDTSYVHLFIWNRENREVVGAYRIGRTDDLVQKQGVWGLYTSTLFHYDPGFFEQLGPALELGRSFVRPECQKSYAPLLLLWKGIARFIIENPQYKTLFGPVSITREYQTVSKQLMVKYLTANKYRADLAKLIRPRKPLRAKGLQKWDFDSIVRTLKDDSDSFSALISCIEEDKKGIPVLLKQYLKLGGQIIGFNVDPAFSHVLDGLIMVDLTRTEPRMLERYLGKDGAQRFLDYHQTLGGERSVLTKSAERYKDLKSVFGL